LLGSPVGATLYDLLIRSTPPDEEQAVIYEDLPSGATSTR